MKTFKEFLKESIKSDAYELAMAEHINSLGKPGGLCEGRIKAKRPQASTQYSDVKVWYIPKKSTSKAFPSDGAWIEVKMNHSDNLVNTRVWFEKNKWHSINQSENSRYIADWISKNDYTKTWIAELRSFLKNQLNWTEQNIKNLIIPKDKAHFGKPNCITPEEMAKFMSTRQDTYFMRNYNVHIFPILEGHLLNGGKAEPASMIQTADDLYRLGRTNFSGFEHFMDLPIPDAIGNVHARLTLRSNGVIEMKPEVKMTKINNASKYSLKPGSTKMLPFEINDIIKSTPKIVDTARRKNWNAFARQYESLEDGEL